MSDWTILCDFDGTVAINDVTDTLLTHFARSGWERLEEQWRAGLIGSRDCMAGQVALLDADRGEINALLDVLPIDPAFSDFVADARRRGVSVRLISDGIDYAITRILGRHGLGDLPVVANRLVQRGPRRWSMESPHTNRVCRAASGTCKCSFADKTRHVLLIGDGQSDFCVARRADFVLAKHVLIDYCQRSGIPHLPITGFTDALGLLPGVLDSSRLRAIESSPDIPALRVQTV